LFFILPPDSIILFCISINSLTSESASWFALLVARFNIFDNTSTDFKPIAEAVEKFFFQKFLSSGSGEERPVTRFASPVNLSTNFTRFSSIVTLERLMSVVVF